VHDVIEANGLRFAYLSEGSGPLVLLFHGFPDTARTWDHVRPQIAARGFRAVTPWMRGYAPTAIPPRDADAETLARDVVALIEAFGEKQALVVGHDWGALAAYGAASLAPEKLRKLVTVAIPHPASITPSLMTAWRVRHFVAYKLRSAPRRFAADDFAALPRIYRRWSPAWNPAPEEFSAVRECFADSASLDAAFGYYRALGFRPPRWKISVPTVVFAGTDDPIVQPATYHAAARFFTNGYTVEEMAGGHFLHREHPQTFVDKLLPHLS
jgi:pimeloyl-ACP methyl ester carboxylesterase